MQRLAFLALLIAACGGQSTSDTAPAAEPVAASPDVDPFTIYTELDVGADYQSFTKINRDAFVSRTHGGRFVDVYVNDVGAAAYLDGDAEIPVGTIVVKDSWETEGGVATDVRGPIFIMEKKEPGFDPEHGDWWYGLHWAEVPEGARGMNGAREAYWRTPSDKIGYCSGCHDSYDRELGGVPDASLAPAG